MRVEHHERESVSRLTTGRRDAVRRDCGHPGIPHAHGTRTAYVSDRCGCTRCRAANRAAEEHRTAAIAVGRWSPYADAQPVREHLERLRQEGLGIERIAGLSNVSRGTVRRLLSYSSEPGSAAPPHSRRDGATSAGPSPLNPGWLMAQAGRGGCHARTHRRADGGWALTDRPRAYDRQAPNQPAAQPVSPCRDRANGHVRRSTVRRPHPRRGAKQAPRWPCNSPSSGDRARRPAPCPHANRSTPRRSFHGETAAPRSGPL